VCLASLKRSLISVRIAAARRIIPISARPVPIGAGVVNSVLDARLMQQTESHRGGGTTKSLSKFTILLLGAQGELHYQGAISKILQNYLVNTINRVFEHKLRTSADVANLRLAFGCYPGDLERPCCKLTLPIAIGRPRNRDQALEAPALALAQTRVTLTVEERSRLMLVEWWKGSPLPVWGSV
jgi:hypothetical protein